MVLVMGDARERRWAILGQMTYRVEFDREDDGRWIAEVPELPGVMVYGESQQDALVKVEALALRHLADLIEHGEASAADLSIAFTPTVAA
jgi:predicted RNase H-like HicB family nuclease